MSEKNDEDWRSEDFTSREYTIDGPDLDDAKSVRVVVYVDNEVAINAQAREPGMLTILSRPDENGIRVVWTEPGGVRYTDFADLRGQYETPSPADWQLEALGLPRNDGHKPQR